MYADNKCQLSDSGRFTGQSNSTEDPHFRLFYLIPSGIMYDWRNDADVYILYLVMVKKYNFKITVNLMAQKRDVIQCIFILKHLFRFENECDYSFLAKNRKRYSTPLRDILN